ncbi:hypothetical protein [Dyella silvatica]|uniref:hypothetical protein n=1 Tax=Dyella silvatica TaxID=2992128 RepID=UPI002250DC20|nr:hypothetical protein [Dyella silvatica]
MLAEMPSTLVKLQSIFSRCMSKVPEGIRRALVPFLLSRFIIVATFASVAFVANVPTAEWGRNDNIFVKLNRENITAGLQRVAIVNDAAWHIGIAQHGYEKRPFDTSRQANWAFFPLHPMLWNAASKPTGEWLWSGLLLANLWAFAGLSMLWHLVRKLADSRERADDAVLFAAFWPTSYFMSLPQTEAMFFALVTLSFLMALSQRWWIAAVGGMLAGATRFNGMFLLPSLFLEWFKGKRDLRQLAALGLIPLGLAGFMAYLWVITGNPMAFKDIQIAWGRQLTVPWTPLMDAFNYLNRIAAPWNPRLLNLVTTLLAIASAVACWRRRWYSLAVFTALTLLAPLSTGTLMSITRYLGVAPGIYLMLAVWAGEHRRLGQLWLVFLAMSQILLCAAFAAGVNIGGA